MRVGEIKTLNDVAKDGDIQGRVQMVAPPVGEFLRVTQKQGLIESKSVYRMLDS